MTRRIEIHEQIRKIPSPAWDALVGADNPFVEHGFLCALEEGRSVGKGSGWLPRYITVWDEQQLVAATPFYLRGDSYGEYIFDWGWAEAAQRAGMRYYPKCTSAIPFTPATGPRLLCLPGQDARPLKAALIQAAEGLAKQTNSSSLHWLFLETADAAALKEHGYLHRASFQFHWENRGWKDFDAFLQSLTRKRRHEIQRERRKVQDAGVEVRVVEGPHLNEDDWISLRRFYVSTTSKMGAIPYLTESTFAQFAQNFAHRVVAVLAYRQGRCIAGTLNFRKGAHLYGRYWGCLEEVPALHFECCYYALISWGIGQGIQRFEAGAQGEHKLARGFMPTLTHSCHRLLHPGLHRAVADFITRERAQVEHVIADYAAAGPYRL